MARSGRWLRMADPLAEFLDEMAQSPVVGLVLAPFVAGLAAVVARGVGTLGLFFSGLAGPIAAASILGLLCAAQLGGAVAAAVRPAEGRRGPVWQIAGIVARLIDVMAPGSVVIIATFALTGTEQCSGLQVRRYDHGALATRLGHGFRMIAEAGETHTTPSGSPQDFIYAVFERTCGIAD